MHVTMDVTPNFRGDHAIVDITVPNVTVHADNQTDQYEFLINFGDGSVDDFSSVASGTVMTDDDGVLVYRRTLRHIYQLAGLYEVSLNTSNQVCYIV